jgi:hypothetical protein
MNTGPYLIVGKKETDLFGWRKNWQNLNNDRLSKDSSEESNGLRV